jgi:DEAD/DEAH box helicase domain-containing protein
VHDEFLCPRCLRIGATAQCPCGTARFAVRGTREDVGPKAPRRWRMRCPSCLATGSLSILGARSPSLGSVLVTHLFATPYNGDRKLLAFTDSVQDASHHAAFFGARTWRFGVRAALQGLLQGPDDAPSLDDLGARLLARAAAESPSLHDRIARWLPTDLVDLPEALRHRDRPDDAARQEALWARIAVRLSWEIVQEYGLGARSLGRTLERTGCSTAAPDADDVTRATRALVADIRAQKMLGPRSDEVDEDDVRHLLDALLDRLRVRGGVFHPLLDRYVEDGANRFLLSKRRQPLLSPFARGVRPPSFLQGVVHSEGFESFAPVQATPRPRGTATSRGGCFVCRWR